MNKSQAIQRIVQMQKLAERTTSEGEKANALDQIVRLKAQFDLTDREIERRVQIEEAGGENATSGIFGGGNKLWFYEIRVKPHVDAIQKELGEALAVIASQDLSNRVELLCELTDAMRAMADANSKDAWLRTPNAQRQRNEAIKEAYKTERDRLAREGHYGFAVDDPIKLHEYAVEEVKRMAGYQTGLTTATVESLVRISAKKLREEQWRKAMEEEDDDSSS